LRTGAGRLELLSALGPETPVGKFLASRGPGLHHVAFEVDDLSAELVRLRGAGITLIDETPRRGLFGLQVAFIHPEATGGVLAELVSDE
jgi:methylmalonyl-CoA epimerase